MVLGNLQVPGLPTHLVYSRAMFYCAGSGCGGVVWTFFLSFTLLFFLPLSDRRPDIA